MPETFEQVGTNTSLMSFGLLLVVVVVLASATVQGMRNSEKRAPKGCILTLLGAAAIFGTLAALRLPDHLLITWLPVGVAVAGSAWLLSTKGWSLGLRLGCTGLLFLLALPFWLQGALLFGRSRASLALREKELVYESDRLSAIIPKEKVQLRVVPISKSKYVLEISDGKTVIPISSRFLFQSEKSGSLTVDELRVKIEKWLSSR